MKLSCGIHFFNMQPSESPELPTLRIEIVAHTTIGYASFQNNVPLLREIRLINSSPNDLANAEVVIEADPPFAECTKLLFDRLAPGETRRISPVDIRVHHSYLSGLTELERARLKMSVRTAGETKTTVDHPVEILAYDQWAGSRALPELLAAFCMPNNPAVDVLLKKSSTLLRKFEDGTALSGYQTKNREHVWNQISAIYNAIAAEDIQYANPPASFGLDGQKIRTPDRILSGKVATCLDLTMLFAACLEQAGINPVVLLAKEHAWIGGWLVPNSFPTPTVEDAQTVRKRVQSGEFMAFETTVLAQQSKVSLKSAAELGYKHLCNDPAFAYAIDIRRARERKILPLPSKNGAANQTSQDLPAGPLPVEAAPTLPPLDAEALTGIDLNVQPDTPAGRLARWKSKLLDLTLRNRLLNFKPTKSNLQLFVPEPASLEDVLAAGSDFRFKALPKLMEGADPRVAAVHVARTGNQPTVEMAREALKRHELLGMVEPDQLDSRLLEIYGNAKVSLEEGGANTLFLALGFLRWTQDERAEATYVAPILLVPVTMQRKSVRSGFTLTRHDDETIVNPTLLQLLKEEYRLQLPGLDPLPKDESGVDVLKIWQIFRLAIGDIPRWEVIEQVYIGTFSFTKYLMWKDLQDRTEDLKQNRVVAHLIDHPGEAFGEDGPEHQPSGNLDERYRPQDLFVPTLADSSQLRAICTASEGKDFVLEGPPGTGKSQTITNLIAHFLASGKTVLFVSEKMAALEVVHRRLTASGLGPFCLELHSSKAKKSEILLQLGQALNFSGASTVTDWEREAERLAKLRKELNSLVQTLHRKHPNDLTVYDATGLIILHRGWTPAPMPWSDPNVHDRATLDGLRETMRTIAALAADFPSLHNHPLMPIARSEWSPSWEDECFEAAASLDQKAASLEEAGQAIAKSCGVPEIGLTLQDYAALDNLADILLQAPAVPSGLASRASDPTVQTRIQSLSTHGILRNKIWADFPKAYSPDIASLNATALSLAWDQARSAWWPKRWFAKRSVSSRFLPYRSDRMRPVDEDLDLLLPKLKQLNEQDKALDGMKADAESILGATFTGIATDWPAVRRHEEWARLFTEATTRFGAGDLGVIQRIRERVQPLAAENRSLLSPSAAVGSRLIRYRDAYREFVSQLELVERLADCKHALRGPIDAAGPIQRIRGIIQRWKGASKQVRSWCSWRSVRAKAITRGLTTIISAIEEGKVTVDRVPDFFEYSYQTWWLKKTIDREPILRSFASIDHERKIKEFRAADAKFQQLTRDYVVATLAGRIPTGSVKAGTDSEMGKLRRELQKQRNLLPLRNLVKQLPTLLPKLKPCLLMSPLSVAQYLDAGHAQFDVVVFDEASQIPVWDAVGAIARGKQLIVVGDPKQLPPTAFFTRTDDAEELPIGEGEVKDLESILDECMGAGLRRLSLEWHYRSRHESLIAFSNARYYDSRLITFPSPVTQDTAVSFRAVAGTYDRGGSRTNRAEAEAIVQEISTHFMDPQRRKKSLGVVTFNQPQKALIETLLEARRKASPDLDRLIAESKDEELFIKNLENVQGDERDIILFSITYGRDAAGKTSMHFGPLNLEGGQRRLNVAISRAREQVVIFSTLEPDQIDLSRVNAAGVIDLKNYLEFAKRGPRALLEQSLPTGLEPESPFEIAVIRGLRDKGWIVHPQVGCSGYRIDLAIVDPHAPGEYLIGVECDGRNYHSGANARDRDRLRQIVLEGLGWKLHRIWSTDWWTNHHYELEKLVKVLDGTVTARTKERDAAKAAPPLKEEPVVQPPPTIPAVVPLTVSAPPKPEPEPDRKPKPTGAAAEAPWQSIAEKPKDPAVKVVTYDELLKAIYAFIPDSGKIDVEAVFASVTKHFGLPMEPRIRNRMWLAINAEEKARKLSTGGKQVWKNGPGNL